MLPRWALALGGIPATGAWNSMQLSRANQNSISSVDGVQIDSSIVIKPIFDLISDRSGRIDWRNRSESNDALMDSAHYPMVKAAEAANFRVPGRGQLGFFYRGDASPPSQIFQSGFIPTNRDRSLRHHLSYAGDSGLISVSRSAKSAEIDAFGRGGENKAKGYIYVIVPEGVPDGYWIPGIFPPRRNPTIRRNQEFAVGGTIPSESIIHAYEIFQIHPGARDRKIVNRGHTRRTASDSAHGRVALNATTGLNNAAMARGTEARKAKTDSRGAVTKSQEAHQYVLTAILTHTDHIRPKRKPHSFFRAGAPEGSALAFHALAPYAQDIFDLLRSWDSPIGRGVKWFDDTIQNLQRAIGGKNEPIIYGNSLKLKIICWIRGEQQYYNPIDEACQRLKGTQKEQHGDQVHRIQALNQLLGVCDDIKQTQSNTSQKFEIVRRCDAFHERAKADNLLESTTEKTLTQEADVSGAAEIGKQYTANSIKENTAAKEEALEILGLYGELFKADLSPSGDESCWSAADIRETRPSGWELIFSALAYLDKYSQNDPNVFTCRGCQHADEWLLLCGTIK